MSIFMWCLVALFTLAALHTVSRVGKRQPVTTPGVAAFVVAMDMLLVVGILINEGLLG